MLFRLFVQAEITESLSATGHTEGDWIIDNEASCVVDGSKHLECSTCNVTLETVAIFAVGHSYGEWYLVREATCELDGEKERLCHCGDVEKISYSANHSLTYLDASYNSNSGYTAIWYCSICNVGVSKSFDPIAASCEFNGLIFGGYENVVSYRLNVSGGVGDYSYNIVVSESFYPGTYTVMHGWSQTDEYISFAIDTDTVNRFNPIAITVWISDYAGTAAFTFYFSNYCSTGCTTSVYIPYELD